MISHWRQVFREQYSWLLLPLFLIVAFTVDNRTGVANVMRVLCFPLVLFALTARDYKAIWANPAARAFWILIAWLNLTLLWDGLSERDWYFFQRNVYLYTLMGMVYLVAAYKPEKQDVVFYTYLFGGFACALLILWDWPGTPGMIEEELKQMEPEELQELGVEHWGVRLYYYTRGILTLNHYVGWMMAVLTIGGLYAAIKSNSLAKFVLYAGVVVCATVLLFSQSRGAWVGTAVGVLVMMMLMTRLTTLMWLGAILVLFAVGLFALPGMEKVWDLSITRADSHRLVIWQEAIPAFIGNPFALLVGFGQSVATGFKSYSHLHSIYFNTLSYGGLVALILYSWILWHIVNKLIPFSSNVLLLCLLVCMQVAFLVDGEYLFVAPSGMMLAYLLPLMWAMFGNQTLVSVHVMRKSTPNSQTSMPHQTITASRASATSS